MSSAPYDMAMITENCKRARKSPCLMRNLTLTDKTVTAWQIIGHTIVLTRGTETVACATIILPGLPLMRASFHSPPVEGHIHVIPFLDMVRILPDLKYSPEYEDEEPQKALIEWAFSMSCDGNLTVPDEMNGNELGVDSRSTITIEINKNFTYRALTLFVNGEKFACSPITNVEIRHVKRGLYILSQAHYYEPVRSASDFDMGTLHIRDDCLDMSTETVHKNFEKFYPTINIFGPETVALKSLVADNSCGPLRPQFPRPAATATFMYPVVGRLVLVDMDDRILLTGELRQIHEDGAKRATVQVSSEEMGSKGCPQCPNGEKCRTIEDAAIIVGKDEPPVTLAGVFPWFKLANARTMIVDLQWTKVCANVTLLMSGALSAHALIRQISAYSAPVVASIVVLEYPANNYTEALVNKHKVFSGVTAHAVPVDMSITENTPCDVKSLGPSKEKWWIQRLAAILSGEDNDTTVIIGSKQLVTGPDSVLGISVQLREKNAISCGYFQPLTEKVIAVAKFENVSLGYVKLTQHGTSNWAAGIPTEVYYSLIKANGSSGNGTKIELDWEFVTTDNMCSSAPIYDPFHLNGTFCSTDKTLCAIGDAARKSRPLVQQTRQHFVVSNLPLSGPYSEEDWRLSEMLQMFNVEQKKFKADADFDCGEDTNGSQTSSSSSTAFFILSYMVLLNS
ncbi:unnamed protein product [Cylicocyclus nassatus]|uniref:Uncharacterized protein n=1 Tax=Cylicocyclus nassatus TaxID=53992 RepID=A0AA36HG06_CYLNA|nr:unnamed protein product [Cylicocyclus nassatus]